MQVTLKLIKTDVFLHLTCEYMHSDESKSNFNGQDSTFCLSTAKTLFSKICTETDEML